MRSIAFVLAVLMLTVAGPAGAETAPGKLKGGVNYTLPAWFKVSFLNFREDIEEARKQGRHVMVFLHLSQCPYCARMLEENFVSGDNRGFMQKHFDVIGVNIRGNEEVTWIDGVTYTEQELARQLKVVATPTIVFLDPDNNKVLQLTGYRDPRALRLALDYVQGKNYRNQSFAAYLAAGDKPAIYALRDHAQFSKATNFKGYQKPLAILFEDRQCAECARFHDKTLNHPEVLVEMKKFQFVRLDTDSNAPVITPDGKTTTPGEWAKALDLSYRPAMVLFDEGREIFRVDGRLYHFHFKETLRYVSGGYYKRYPTLSAYNVARRDELLNQGIDIDYAE